jgi:hypothetical protein
MTHLRPPWIGVGTPAWRSGRSSPVGQLVAARLVVMAGIEVHGRLVGQRPHCPPWCQGGGQQRVVRSRRFAPLGKVTKLGVAWVFQGDHAERNVTTFSGLLPFCCQLAPQGRCGAALVLVGLPGLEPGTSSLSAKCREPLCGRPFPQVTTDRRRRSYVLSSRSVKRSHGPARARRCSAHYSAFHALAACTTPPSSCGYASITLPNPFGRQPEHLISSPSSFRLDTFG